MVSRNGRAVAARPVAPTLNELVLFESATHGTFRHASDNSSTFSRMTDVQLQILRSKFPGIGEATLKRNASLLLAPSEPLPVKIGIAVAPEPHSLPKPVKTKAKGKGKTRVVRTRNAATLTESGYWGFVRSTLRRAFRFWKPAVIALKRTQVPMAGPRGRKWGYVCAGCSKIYLRKQVQIDHKEPAGALTDYAHVGDFLRRLTPENPDSYQVLCTGEGTAGCHDAKTAREREAKTQD